MTTYIELLNLILKIKLIFTMVGFTTVFVILITYLYNKVIKHIFENIKKYWKEKINENIK